MDLNQYRIEDVDSSTGWLLENNSIQSNDITVHFRNLKEALISYINNSDIIIGCVAWLTDFDILDALAKKRFVSLVVQKEDFLRPDTNRIKNWEKLLRNKYDNLRTDSDLTRYNFTNSILCSMSVCGDPSIDPVRCVGNYNERNKVSPRMHNKFLVFCNIVETLETTEDQYLNCHIDPISVWTGSFNLTQNATYSLENAVHIANKKIATAYYKEFGQIAAISESLDWTHKYISPEWRIGT